MDAYVLAASDIINQTPDSDKFTVKMIKADNAETVVNITIPDACFYSLGKIGVINIINDLIVASRLF